MAQSGRASLRDQCLLSGLKRTCPGILTRHEARPYFMQSGGTFRVPTRCHCTMAKRTFILLVLILAAGPAVAKDFYPIAVPGECYELAQREGVPVVISNRYEAFKAKVKLAGLRESDPMVHVCREAVNRARQTITHASQ